MFIALQIASAGFYNGNIAVIMDTRVDHVIACLEFTEFKARYESVFTELNT